jgi:hypothetical protein
MIDSDTRLRVASGIAKTETEASQIVFTTLKQRDHPDKPPPTISDGWGASVKRWLKSTVECHLIPDGVGHQRLSNQVKIGNISKWSSNGKTVES